MNDTNQVAESNQRRISKRWKRVVLSCTILCAILFLLAITGIYDITAPYRYKWQLKDRLEQVSTLKEAERAAGSLGVALDHGNGQWTVIAYKDAHNFGHPSVAIAKTSEGLFFESQLHHCGLFKIYKSRRADYLSWGDGTREDHFANDDQRLQLMNRLEVEQDQKIRKQLLNELGFRELSQ